MEPPPNVSAVVTNTPRLGGDLARLRIWTHSASQSHADSVLSPYARCQKGLGWFRLQAGERPATVKIEVTDRPSGGMR